MWQGLPKKIRVERKNMCDPEKHGQSIYNPFTAEELMKKKTEVNNLQSGSRSRSLIKYFCILNLSKISICFDFDFSAIILIKESIHIKYKKHEIHKFWNESHRL